MLCDTYISNVAPDHVNVVISVSSVLLMLEPKRVKQLMDNNLVIYMVIKGSQSLKFGGLSMLPAHLDINTAILLQTNLQSTITIPVRQLGITASTTRYDVHIVNLIGASYKPV